MRVHWNACSKNKKYTLCKILTNNIFEWIVQCNIDKFLKSILPKWLKSCFVFHFLYILLYAVSVNSKILQGSYFKDWVLHWFIQLVF